MMKPKSDRLMCLVLTFLIFCSSKTIFGGQIYGNETLVFLAGITLFFLIRSKKVKLNNLIQAVYWVGLLILVCILNGNDNYLYIIKIVFSIIVLSMIATLLSSKDFMQSYISVVAFFSVVSLVFFTISLISINTAYELTSLIKIGDLSYFANPLYTLRSADSYSSRIRNSGPFWEPGAFQGFIILAIMFLIRSDHIKAKKVYLVILIVTLITTQSTTGYIALLMLAISCHEDVLTIIFGEKSAKRYKFFYILLTVAIVVLILNSVTIQNKFVSTNVSYAIRRNDFINSIKIMKSSVVFGYGCGTNASIALSNYGIVRNSNGLFQMIIYFGVPFGVIYIYHLFSWFKEYLFVDNHMIKNVTFIAILFMILSTEGLCFLPLYLFMLFKLRG